MELTGERRCCHPGVYLVDDCGGETEQFKYRHRASVCDACGHVVVCAEIDGRSLFFDFPIASPEAVDVIVRSCRQSAQGGT